MSAFPRIIPCILIFLCACSSTNDNEKKETTKDSSKTEEQFVKGRVIDSIRQNTDQANSFALYLPAGFTSQKKYPLVLVFDPAGDGRVPLSLYRSLADKYGYILAASNNIKNGMTWQETTVAADKLFRDLTSRLPVDSARIYTLGFSGGARIAHGLALINEDVTGAICCGAIVPAGGNNSPRKEHTFIAVVGTKDLNYTEVQKYVMLDMAGHSIRHTMLLYDGYHAWPPVDVIDEALLWMELNEMRKDPSKKDQQLIESTFRPRARKLDTLLKNGQNYEAYLFTKRTINYYEGLADLKPFFGAYVSFTTDPAVDRGLKKEEASWKKEEQLKQEYARPAVSQTPEWWKKETQELKEKISVAEDVREALVYERLLEYLSLYMYAQLNNAFAQNDFAAAERFSKIYLYVDADNPEAHYQAARVAAMKSDGTAAIAHLNAALKYGFRDSERLKKEVVFATTRNSAEFREIEKKLATE